MKSSTVQCVEHPVRILYNDDRTLAWINLSDLCAALGREEMLASKEAMRLCTSCIRIPFHKRGREMWAVSPYDVYKLIRPMRKENALAARKCDLVEAWLNELLEESALHRAEAERQDVVFNYQDHPISFRAANGHMMINATQMAKSFGILPSEIIRKAEFMRYRQNLVDRGFSESLDSQIFTTRGRNNGATWVEEALAMEVARQLSPEFSRWCNEKIRELVTRGYATLDRAMWDQTGEENVSAQPLPQNLEEAQQLILTQRQEITSQQERIRADRYKVEFYDTLIEGRDFFSTTWIAQELDITARMLHRFLSEQGVCSYVKGQWIALGAYRSWQIEAPYYRNDYRRGRRCYSCMRMRWNKAGREEVIALWRRNGTPLPEATHRIQEDRYSDLREGVDYFSPRQAAQLLGISAVRLNRFLAENRICKLEKGEWVACKPYAKWQIAVPYYWTNPKTGVRGSFGRRKRWTALGLEQIAKLWKKQHPESENTPGHE